MLGYFDVGTVSLVIDGNNKLLQGFPNQLGSLQLQVACCFQVVVTVAILKHLSNLFVRRSGRDAM
jgi:hypothetical protein